MLSVKVDRIPILPIGDLVDQGPTKTKKAFDKLAKKVVVGNKMHVLAKKSQKCILMKEILILTVNLYANASNKKIIIK